MKSQLRAVFVVFLALTVITGIAYPLVVTLIAQGVFSHQANGSVIEKNGKVVGSALIGQNFSQPEYFWGRPSATTPAYNGGSSTGSNLGPTNPDYLKAVEERVTAMKAAHPDQAGAVPVDLVTTSASGLDPEISPAAAEYQVGRVARARGKSVDEIRALVRAHTSARTLGVLGEARVNVLKLNLALVLQQSQELGLKSTTAKHVSGLAANKR